MERGEMFNGRVDMSQGAQAAFNSVHLYFWMSRVLSLSPRPGYGVRAGLRREIASHSTRRMARRRSVAK